MRIISGNYKGRQLSTPSDYSIRPTTDKVKEALFSMLSQKIPGCRFLDLFSGTGSIGLEALSRGADSCVFVDNSRDSLKLIKDNINHCRAEENAHVLAGDYRKVLGMSEVAFDIIFLDPPYGKGYLQECFRLIRENGKLVRDGVIIAEHRKEEKLPEEFFGYNKVKEKKYGVIILSIYS